MLLVERSTEPLTYNLIHHCRMPVSTGYMATWGSRHTKLFQGLGLGTIRIKYQFRNMGGRRGEDIHEYANIKSQRSVSEPTIPQTIINQECLVPISFTKMETVKNMMREVSKLLFVSSRVKAVRVVNVIIANLSHF